MHHSETTTGLAPVADEIVWQKLCAMRDGAAIATRRLFGERRFVATGAFYAIKFATWHLLMASD